VFLQRILFDSEISNRTQISVGKISYTADLWSDSNLRSYLAMTAHWVARHENALQMKSSLIAFQRVWGKHTGKNLSKVVFDMMERVGVTSKVIMNSKLASI
jgi:hypothetical protein